MRRLLERQPAPDHRVTRVFPQDPRPGSDERVSRSRRRFLVESRRAWAVRQVWFLRDHRFDRGDGSLRCQRGRLPSHHVSCKGPETVHSEQGPQAQRGLREDEDRREGRQDLPDANSPECGCASFQRKPSGRVIVDYVGSVQGLPRQTLGLQDVRGY